MTQPEAIPASPRVHRLKLYYEQHEHKLAIGFFIGGFLFDVLTLGRVDSWLTIGQEVLYLLIITTALMQMFFEQGKPPRALEKMFVVKRWYVEYRTAIVHFFLGALLSLNTVFFFKSSSLLVSFSFLAFLAGLLVANESSRFKALGLAFKFALLSLCVLCFFARVVPIFVGSIGLIVFLLSMLIGTLPPIAIAWLIRNYAPDRFGEARRQILMPFGFVLIGFLIVYVFRLIPPVPVSIPFIGVYHGVERTEEGYRLSHERAQWRFWDHGDQEFLARPGDVVYVFFRIFSPTHFSDKVTMRWYWKDNANSWKLQDSIPIKIVGGRELGFRGYGVKSHYQPGAWKVQVETTDGREIGRVYFNLETAPEAQRMFQVEIE